MKPKMWDEMMLPTTCKIGDTYMVGGKFYLCEARARIDWQVADAKHGNRVENNIIGELRPVSLALHSFEFNIMAQIFAFIAVMCLAIAIYGRRQL